MAILLTRTFKEPFASPPAPPKPPRNIGVASGEAPKPQQKLVDCFPHDEQKLDLDSTEHQKVKALQKQQFSQEKLLAEVQAAKQKQTNEQGGGEILGGMPEGELPGENPNSTVLLPIFTKKLEEERENGAVFSRVASVEDAINPANKNVSYTSSNGEGALLQLEEPMANLPESQPSSLGDCIFKAGDQLLSWVIKVFPQGEENMETVTGDATEKVVPIEIIVVLALGATGLGLVFYFKNKNKN